MSSLVNDDPSAWGASLFFMVKLRFFLRLADRGVDSVSDMAGGEVAGEKGRSLAKASARRHAVDFSCGSGL